MSAWYATWVDSRGLTLWEQGSTTTGKAGNHSRCAADRGGHHGGTERSAMDDTSHVRPALAFAEPRDVEGKGCTSDRKYRRHPSDDHTRSPKTYPLQVTTSPEWSSHYNTTVYIYKQRIGDRLHTIFRCSFVPLKFSHPLVYHLYYLAKNSNP